MKKMNVAIIGCGTIAKAQHAPGYGKNPKANIKYCVDIIPERAEELKEMFGAQQALTDYREILSDSELDAVSVCVPNYLHAPISIDFLNSGKSVLCEKPAAVNYGEVLQMQQAADKNNCILNIGVVNRFNTSVNKIKDIIDSGRLGEVYHTYCSFRSYRSIPGLGGQFTTKKLSGGGVLIDWGVHFLDLILYVLGLPEILSASAMTYSKLGKNLKDYSYIDMWAGPPDYSGTNDVEEFVTGMVRLQGSTITLNGAWAQNIDERAMFVEFLGTKGGIKLDYGKGFTMWTDENGVLYEHTPAFKSADMFYDEIDAFLTSVSSKEKNRANVDNVAIVAKLMDAIYLSAEENKEVIFE